MEQFEPRMMLANVAPSGMDATVTTLEDTKYTFGTADFGFSDVADLNRFHAVRIATLPLKGILINDVQPVVVGQFIPVADLAVGKLQFAPALNENGTSYTSIAFQVQDDGETLNGGIDLDPTPNTITFDVIPVNDAPQGYNEVVGIKDCLYYPYEYHFAVSDFAFTDAYDYPANSMAGVTIVTIPNYGTLTNNGSPVVAGQFIPAADFINDRVRYTPSQIPYSYSTIIFQVKDNGGTANGGIDLDPTPNTLSLSISGPPLRPPLAYNLTRNMLEDTPYVFQVADFPLDDWFSDNLQSVILLSSAASGGLLTYNGVAVTSGQSIPAIDIELGRLRYTPPANAWGTALARLAFDAVGDGGTCYPGGDLRTKVTINLNVTTTVNDPPIGGNRVVHPAYGAAYAFSTSDFGFSDPDDSWPNELKAVIVTSIPQDGTLTDNGVAITSAALPVTVPIGHITASRFVYSAPLFAGLTTFNFQLQDDGGTANGGVDTETEQRVMSLLVSDGNTPPLGTSQTISTLEDTPYVFGISDFPLLTTEEGNTKAVSVASLPASGLLTDNGVAVFVGQSIAADEISLGRFKYSPAPNANGAAATSFGYQVLDTGGTATSGNSTATLNTITFDVTPVNDPPSASGRNLSVFNCGGGYTFSPSDFSFSDPYDSPANNLLTVRLANTGAGTLTLNGLHYINNSEVTFTQLSTGKLVYTPSGFVPTSITFTVRDDGGVANGGVEVDPTPRVINITASGGPPTAPFGIHNTVTTNEDKHYVFKFSDFRFLDAENNNLKSVTIGSPLPVQGVLRLNGNDVGVYQRIDAYDITLGRLVFFPLNGHGLNFAQLLFRVQDDGGACSGGADTDTTFRVMMISVNSVNDAPSGENSTIGNRLSQVIVADDFGFKDQTDYLPGNSLKAVRIATLPSEGILALSGLPVSVGQLIAIADITGNRLKFVPPTSSNAAYASFTFQVQDDGGTANGGVDLDQSPNTLNIVFDSPAGHNSVNPADVNGDTVVDFPDAIAVMNWISANGGGPFPAPSFGPPFLDVNGDGFVGFDDVSLVVDAFAPGNRPPSSEDRTVTTPANIPYVLSQSDFYFRDQLDYPPHNFLAVEIKSLPTEGTLYDDGVAVVAGQQISVNDLAAGKVRYLASHANSLIGGDQFNFVLKDDGGSVASKINGAIYRFFINFSAAVNVAPRGEDRQVSLLEDETYSLRANDFGFSDAGNAPQNSLMGVRIAELPARGTLVRSGSPVNVGDVISAADLMSGLLGYVPEADESGSEYASFAFQVQDDGGTANGGADIDATLRRLAFNIAPVNDSPSFVKGDNQQVNDLSGQISIEGWATEVSAGAEGLAQHWHFEVTTDDVGLFAALPAVDENGRLTYEPAAGMSGTAEVRVVLVDDGGTENGGVDRSEVQTFAIEVRLELPWHNREIAEDVTGDGDVVGEDVLDVINYINAFGSGPVVEESGLGIASVTSSKKFYDVTGDNYVAADDVLAIINFINAQPEVEQEAAWESRSEGEASTQNNDALMAMLAEDAARARRKR